MSLTNIKQIFHALFEFGELCTRLLLNLDAQEIVHCRLGKAKGVIMGDFLPLIQFETVSNEDVTGETYNYTEGYGQLTKAGVTVQKGASGKASVDTRMKVITNQQTQSWYIEHKSTYTDAQQKEIESYLEEGNTSSAWKAMLRWGAGGEHSEDKWKKENTLDVNVTDKKQIKVLNSLRKMESKDVHITGDVIINGYSYLPTTAFIFAQVSIIAFKDGTKAKVINKSVTAADGAGNTSGVEVKPGRKIKIVPIL